MEILEIVFNNESEYESQESDSDSAELPPNLVVIENPESEFPLSIEEVPFEDAGGDGGRPTVDKVQEFCGSWKAPSHFSPPDLAGFFSMSPSLE